VWLELDRVRHHEGNSFIDQMVSIEQNLIMWLGTVSSQGSSLEATGGRPRRQSGIANAVSAWSL
jgi:hypothetical protein